MRRSLTFVAASVALIAASSASAKDWDEKISFDAACKKAAAEKKLVFVEFFAHWCAPCKMMDDSTFKDPKVIEWLNKHTVPLKINADTEVVLGARYRVNSLPTLLFLKPDGTEIDRLLGLMTSEQLLEAGDGVLRGKDSIARAREKLETGDPTDPVLRMQLAVTYSMRHKYAEALAEYLWCLDHCFEKRPDMVGLRPYLLREVVMLGQVYPQAITELSKRREQAARRVFADTPSADDVLSFVVLSEAFGGPGATIKAYDELRGNPKLSIEARQTLVHAAMPQLLQVRRYADIAADIDVMAMIDEQFSAAAQAPVQDEALRSMLIVVVAGYYQVLVGLNRVDDAAKVVKRLTEFADTADTYNALAWSGYLTGKPTEANVRQARKAYELTQGRVVSVIDTLARVLYARGKKQEAITLAREGLQKSIELQDRAMMERCLADLK